MGLFFIIVFVMNELNSQQKSAVEHDQGPLLIVAGAGTGKTKVITSRIVELINSGKAGPEEILALTFTEKAANEMVERVDQSLPLGYEELMIKTFHAFSERILRESGLEIGLDPGFKLLPQVEQWFFFKKNLYKFELNYYRPLGNPNKFIYDLLSHFGKLKDELISPERYLEFANGIEDEEGEKMREIANVYKQYQELLIANNYLDFADLTYLALELFEKRKSVLARYQEKFKYILVDEFQDTNFAQFDLVLKLSEKHRNVVVVGDDDQSIYKWRGASLSNILQFEEKFPDCKKIVLVENYRSTEKILKSSYGLIQNNNPDRLEIRSGLKKELKCNVKFDEEVEVHDFPNFVQESEFVAGKIKELHESKGIAYGEFAILVRSNNLAHNFIEELKYLQIPYQVRSPKGLIALPEIKDLIAVVKFLANPKDNIALLRILKMEIFAISMEDILLILNKGRKDYLWNNLKVEGAEDNLTIPGSEDPLTQVADLLKYLMEFSKNASVGLVFNEFLQKSRYLHHLIENEGFEAVENINQFARQVNRFEKETTDNSVLDFVNYLNLLEEANSTLNYESSPDKDAVQVLTVHGAKGLEFRCVFVVNAVNQRFPSTKRREVFELPEELTKEIYPEGDFHVQEERRLFYVAMTRAREHLYITYSHQYEGNKKWRASLFVDEVLNSGVARPVAHEEDSDAIQKLKEFKAPKVSLFKPKEVVSKRFSYTQLDTFGVCPLKYSYNYLYKVPVPPTHTFSFGSSVHGTLNDFYQNLKSGKEVSLKLMKELYEKNWIPNGYESVEHEQIRKEKGWEVLENFYKSNSDPWASPAFLERPFNLKINDYYLTGRIDRIDKLPDGTYEVIDYKTGRLKDSIDIDKDLQLSIYALACKNVFKLNVSKLSLYYLEDNEKLSTTRNEKQLAELEDRILEVIEQIRKSDFAPTPAFHCNFCDFRLICPAA